MSQPLNRAAQELELGQFGNVQFSPAEECDKLSYSLATYPADSKHCREWATQLDTRLCLIDGMSFEFQPGRWCTVVVEGQADDSHHSYFWTRDPPLSILEKEPTRSLKTQAETETCLCRLEDTQMGVSSVCCTLKVTHVILHCLTLFRML